MYTIINTGGLNHQYMVQAELGGVGVATQEVEKRSASQRSILDLPHYVDSLSVPQREIFERIFRLQISQAPVFYPNKQLHEELAKAFKTSLEDMKVRRGLRVTNIVLDEETLYSPIRSNRPMIKVSGSQRPDSSKGHPKDGCPFCQVLEGTPEETWGRVEGEYCISAANAAAYDAWHGLIIPKEIHDPSDLTEEVLEDMLTTGNEWFRRVNEYSPRARFPLMGLNINSRAGASIFHPHLQVLLAEDSPYQKVEDLRRRTADYRDWNDQRPYLNDLAESMAGLGLVFDTGSAHTIFNLTPRKEKEVLIFMDDQKGMPNGDLSRASFGIIKWWREYGVTSYNMVIFMPPLGEDLRWGEWSHFSPSARLVDRGDAKTATSDMGFMETYASPVVVADPFTLAQSFTEYLKENAAA